MTEENTEVPQPPKRRRGRPRKNQAADEQQAGGSQQAGEQAQAPKRRRGRPRKSQAAEEGQAQAPATQERAQQPREQADQRDQRERPQASQQPQRASQFRQQPRPGRGQYQQSRFQQAQANRRRNRHNATGGAQNSSEPRLSREALSSMRVAELRVHAADLGVEYVGVRKGELVEAVYVAAARAEGFRSTAGVLDITGEGYGFVRTGNYMQGEDDAFVPQQLIKHLGLRRGDWIEGTVRPSRPNDKYPALQKVASVNGLPCEAIRDRPRFRDLTPVYPDERLTMEHGKDSITGRAIDLVAPIGKGQRGLIVSPPKAGKTTVLKRVCESIVANNPEVHLICLLVDERLEEVTDMQRTVKGEVIASTFDRPASDHTIVAELAIARAKRLVELGQDVVVLLDSITRLGRAYNLAAPASGRILSGGVDASALYPPKRFFGAARNVENGGSLTILATALVETGSKMDEVIFEEFKGTGNMELRLSRQLADKRIFPAVDVAASGTRREELLIDPAQLKIMWRLRRLFAGLEQQQAIELVLSKLKDTQSNAEFLMVLSKTTPAGTSLADGEDE